MSPLIKFNIQEKANRFSYITFKMQASMYGTDEKFYSLDNTVERISTCVFACASGSLELLTLAKSGIVEGFNQLKKEENIPILSYKTMDELMKVLDEKLLRRVS